MTHNLLPISEIIRQAKNEGVEFGSGDPKTHLAYLTRLHLLPQTVRRKIGEKISGCYPPSVVEKLKTINRLRNQGLTYSQIRMHLVQNGETILQTASPLPAPSYSYLSLPVSRTGNAVAFLIVGLILGYLISFTNLENRNLLSLQTEDLAADRNLTSNYNSQNSGQLMKSITSNSQTDSEPLYLIALPRQNLDRLGKINIERLNY